MTIKDTLNLPDTDFPMRARLPEREPEILERWRDMDLYGRLQEERHGAPIFILHDGPPYANGRIHLGTALNKILKDLVVRTRAMAGFDVPFVPGWDCHGMPIEHNVTRQMGDAAKEAETLEIRRRCRAYANRFVDIQSEEFQRLGVLGRWDAPYLTMHRGYEAEVLRTFADLVRGEYVSKGLRSIHWCGSCRTALAEAELEYADHVSPSIFVGFPVVDDGAAAELTPALPEGVSAENLELVIWTTTPWTIPANQAIAVRPDTRYAAVRVDGPASEDGVEDAPEAARKEADGVSTGGPVASGRYLVIAADLVSRTMAEIGVAEDRWDQVARIDGTELEGLHYRHPLFRRTSPVILSEYVTLEQGSGLVHTAPGHGQEDFEIGREYGLEVLCPVDEGAVFDAGAGPFAGLPVFEANPEIVEALADTGHLLAHRDFEHSYPHCWRCKSPLIYRATEQWFVNVDSRGLRDRLLDHIREDVRWIPEWGRERIGGMVESRPDWCLSRQRSWGVPIPGLYCRACGALHLDAEVVDRAVAVVSDAGSDAWFERPLEEFVPDGAACEECGSSEFRRETDIFDVWFEAGVSHRAVLDTGHWPELQWPADLYVEGHDQHRGWFQVSLITAVATREQPPYGTVVTHGFVLDEEGRKMSKSLGNVVRPQELWEEYGADIMRLYFASVDVTRDVHFSRDLLQPTIESYRKIRNTMRFLLGNLSDFDPRADSVDPAAWRPADRWVMDRAAELQSEVVEAYDEFRFHRAVQRLHRFCVVTLSATYLDIAKDRLYCSAAEAEGRRAAQTVIYRLADALTRWMAPVIPYTCEEIWGHLPGDRADSVHLSRFPDLSERRMSGPQRSRLATVMEIRDAVLQALETARESGDVGSSLEATVHLRLPEGGSTSLQEHSESLQELFIVSAVDLLGTDEEFPEDVVAREEAGPVEIAVARAGGRKCGRCWMWRESVGRSEEYPELCERCVGVVESVMATDAESATE